MVRVMLTVGSYDKQGGTNTFVRHLSRGLAEAGEDVTVMSHRLAGERFQDREIQRGLRVRYFPAFPRRKYFLPLYVLRFVWMALYSLFICQRNKVQVILTGETEALPFLLCRLIGVRIVIRGGNPFPKVTKMEFGRKKRVLNDFVFGLIDLYERIILWLADDIVILAKWERDILKDYTSKKMKMIRYAVDVKKFSPGRGGRGLLYVGRISYSKRIGELLEMFDLVRKRVKTELVLVGPLEDYDSIGGFVKGRKGVRYLGEKQADEIPGLLRKAKIFVHTAFDLGNAPLEAASCGLPVVVLGTKFDEPYIFCAGGKKEFADEVVKLLQDKRYWKKVSDKNRRVVEKEHSWDRVTGQYLELFESLC